MKLNKDFLDTHTYLCLFHKGFSLPLDRLGENHCAVRFGDTRKYKVFYNNIDISIGCTEAFASRENNGWAIKYCSLSKSCFCLLCPPFSFCFNILIGNIRIENVLG